jgi:hypothetical protein
VKPLVLDIREGLVPGSTYSGWDCLFDPERSRNMATAIETISTMKAITIANLMNAKKSPKTMISRFSNARANVIAIVNSKPRPIPIPIIAIPINLPAYGLN